MMKIIVLLLVIVAVIAAAAYFTSPHGGPAASPAGQAQSAPAAQPAVSAKPAALPGMTMLADGLQVEDLKAGTGAEAKAGEMISVTYEGRLADGTVFDASSLHGGTPFQFLLGAGQVIKGWDEGVAGMKVGGTRKLVIPPELGYGSQSIGSIPPNSTLTFTVNLLSVSTSTGE